jgi:hypothetical protein
MVCEDCQKGKIVMHAFSVGKCEQCNCEVVTSHTPGDKLCDDCSEKHNSCKECGIKIEVKMKGQGGNSLGAN